MKPDFQKMCFKSPLEITELVRHLSSQRLMQYQLQVVSILAKELQNLQQKGLKKCVLELGGSDPFVVLEDAYLDHAARQAAHSRLLNTGQSCVAAKRFIVVKDVADKFTKLFVENTEAEVVGDPMDSKTTIGPLVRESQRQALIRQVEDAKLKGAKILAGGNIVEGDGYFYEPTIIFNVSREMDVLREEVL